MANPALRSHNGGRSQRRNGVGVQKCAEIIKFEQVQTCFHSRNLTPMQDVMLYINMKHFYEIADAENLVIYLLKPTCTIIT